MTREGLHELVWSQPMQTIAKSMGISDVALAKQCRRADVPVPPRGWWAKKAAGRLVRVQPLAPSPFVLRNYFPAVDLEKTPTEPNGNPVKPIFRDLTIVSKEIEEAVCSVRIPKDLSHPHPIVVRLLQQDEGRKKEQNGKGWMSDFWGPKFVIAIQQRRLRLLAKDAQVKALTEGTNAFEMAGRIRRYVTSVKERYGATRSEEVDRWAKWALEKADELDPLASGSFFTETDFC